VSSPRSAGSALEFSRYRGELRLRFVERFHDLELFIFERRDAAVEGNDLVLHVRQVLGIGDLSGVHPLFVAQPARLDLLHLAVGLLLFAGQVGYGRVGFHSLTVDLGRLGGEVGDSGIFGQRIPAMSELREG